MNISSKISSASLMVSGLCIGGAMVGMPAALAPLGFLGSFFLLSGCALLMGLTAILTNELASYGPEGTHFLHMAKDSLGSIGQWLITACYVVLLYALLAAYMSGLDDLIDHVFHLVDVQWSPSLFASFCVVFIALLIVFGVNLVAKVNRWLMLSLFVAFVIVILLFSQHDVSHTSSVLWNSSIPFLNSAVMIAMTSFGYHILIPTLRGYLDYSSDDCNKSFMFGTLISLLIYSIWLGFVYHVSDSSVLDAIRQGELGPSQIMTTLASTKIQTWVLLVGQAFLVMALLTSFIGVLISLQDFYLDALPVENSIANRSFTMLLCLALPVVFIVFYPHGFILALQYAGCMVLILHGVFPCIAVLIMRCGGSQQSHFISNWQVILLLLIFIAAITLWVGSLFL